GISPQGSRRRETISTGATGRVVRADVESLSSAYQQQDAMPQTDCLQWVMSRVPSPLPHLLHKPVDRPSRGATRGALRGRGHRVQGQHLEWVVLVFAEPRVGTRSGPASEGAER